MAEVGNFHTTPYLGSKIVFWELLFMGSRNFLKLTSSSIFFLELEFAELYVFGPSKLERS